MKTCVPILCLAVCVLYAEEAQCDPCAPAMKTAAELIQCANGHKTLRNVPVVYGHVGGLKNDPVIAAKAERGDIVFGGCMAGGQDHLVVCKTCRLSYVDFYEAWEESFPPDPYAPDSKKNPPCMAETIRQKFSKELMDVTLDVAGADSSFPSCTRWLDASGTVGEQIQISTEARTTEFQTKLETWMRKRGATENPIIDHSDSGKRRWEWTNGGKSFEVNIDATVKGGSEVRLEWHNEKRNGRREQAAPSDGHKSSGRVPSDRPTAPADAH
jgi:hypothetical protein